jgi:hypothetical protein
MLSPLHLPETGMDHSFFSGVYADNAKSGHLTMAKLTRQTAVDLKYIFVF